MSELVSLSTVFVTSPFDLILSSYLEFSDYLRLSEISKTLFDELHARPWILVHFGERKPFLCVFGKGNARNNYEDGFPVLLDGNDESLLRRESIRLRRKLIDIKNLTPILFHQFNLMFMPRVRNDINVFGHDQAVIKVSILITYWKRVMFSRTASWYAVVILAYIINKHLMRDVEYWNSPSPIEKRNDSLVANHLCTSNCLYNEVWDNLYDIFTKIMLHPFYIKHFVEHRNFALYVLRDLVFQMSVQKAAEVEVLGDGGSTDEIIAVYDAILTTAPRRRDNQAYHALANMLYHSLGGYHEDILSEGPFKENKYWMRNRSKEDSMEGGRKDLYYEQRVPFLPDWLCEKDKDGLDITLTPLLNTDIPNSQDTFIPRTGTFWNTMGWHYSDNESSLYTHVAFAETQLNSASLRSFGNLGLHEFIYDAVSVNDDSKLYKRWYRSELQSRLTSNSTAMCRMEVSPLLLDGPLTHSLISAFRMVERLLQLDSLTERASLCSAFKRMHILYYMCSAVLRLIPDDEEGTLSRLQEVEEGLDTEIENDHYEFMDIHMDRRLMRFEDKRQTEGGLLEELDGILYAQSGDALVTEKTGPLQLWLPSFFDHYNTSFHRLISSFLVSMCYVYRWGLLDGDETLPETDLHENTLPYRTLKECLALTFSQILMCLRITWKHLAPAMHQKLHHSLVENVDPLDTSLENKLRTAYRTFETDHAPHQIPFLPANLLAITRSIEIPLLRLCDIQGRELFHQISNTMAVQSFRSELLLFRDEIYKPMLSHFDAFKRGEHVFRVYLNGEISEGVDKATFGNLEQLILWSSSET